LQVSRVGKGISRIPLDCVRVGGVSSTRKGAESGTVLETLFAVTHEGATLLSLPELRLRAQAYRTNAGSALAWNREKALLAVAVRKRCAPAVLSHLHEALAL
jgi:hypothetical protein